MKCSKCHNEIPTEALFCPKCGSEKPRHEGLPSIGDQPTLGRGTESLSVGGAPTVRSRTLKTAQQVMGRYKILGELGRGGMGVVYKCLDEVGGIEVALKALPPELSHNSSEMEEVRENFQLVCKLAHPHIATVRTLERDPQSGDYFLILELVEGVDVRKWRKQQGGKVSLDKAIPVLRQIAQALDFAHSKRVIHRDIKPGNVLVATDGTVKVLDFGLAAQIQSSLSRVSQVHFSTSGTGPYMAPEQWRGKKQDGATDQYALAATAYELLSGNPPFDAQDQFALRESVIHEAPDKLGELTAPQWAALARALSKEPSARFPSCVAFIDALINGGSSRGDETQKNSTPKRGEKTKTGMKSKTPLLVGLVIGLLLVCLAGWYFGKVLPEEKRGKAELAQARAGKDAADKAEAERLRIEREKQAAAEKAKTEAETRERERLANAKGGLMLKTEPTGATVTLGGEDVQTSPATFKGIKIGKYPLRVSLEGYEPVNRDVEIKENDFTDLGILKLVRSVGSVQLSSDPEGSAYELKGTEVSNKSGTTPGLEKDLPTGSYTVVMHRGDWEQGTKVLVERGKTSEGKVEFVYGSVSIKSEPAGAKVMAGGKELGQTPLELKDLRPGSVSYTLKLSKYKDTSVSGTVETKKELVLNAKLDVETSSALGERGVKPSTLFSGSVVAKGNGLEIRRGQLDAAIIAYKANLAARNNGAPEESQDVLETKLLDRLISTGILLRKATGEDNSKATELTEKYLTDARKQFPSEEVFSAQIKASGLSVEQFRSRILEQNTCEVVLDREIRSKIQIADEQMKNYYRENPAEFVQQGRTMEFAEVSAKLKEFLIDKEFSKQVPDYLIKLKKECNVEITDPKLKATSNADAAK